MVGSSRPKKIPASSFERLKPAIRGALWIILWWQGNVAEIEIGLHQADAQALKAILGKGHGDGLVARWRFERDLVIPLPRREIDPLLLGGHLARQPLQRDRINNHGDNRLAEVQRFSRSKIFMLACAVQCPTVWSRLAFFLMMLVRDF
jgi:hypothetical protein